MVADVEIGGPPSTDSRKATDSFVCAVGHRHPRRTFPYCHAYEATINRWAESLDRDGISQKSLAEKFCVAYGGAFWPDGTQLRFDPRRNTWRRFNGDRWELARGILSECGLFVEELIDLQDSPQVRQQWLKRSVFGDIATLAAEALTTDTWDADPEILPLADGSFHSLATGEAWPNLYAVPVAKYAAANPTPCPHDGECEWDDFLAALTGRDDEMLDALQVAIGASAFGHNADHRLNIVVGDGGTGKSLFLSTVAAALGDHATAAPAAALSGSGDHPTAVAGVATARFATVSEVTGGMWRENTVKALTGGDPLSVRFMRADYHVVRPNCSLWVASNEPPALRMVDKAMRRRLRVWPFNNTVENPDPELGDRLRDQALGCVLAWILEGARAYAVSGLINSTAVAEASKDYFTASDSVGLWLDACTGPSLAPELDTTSSRLFKHYVSYCEAEGIRPLGRPSWNTTMSRRVDKRRGMKGSLYKIEIVDDDSNGSHMTANGSALSSTPVHATGA